MPSPKKPSKVRAPVRKAVRAKAPTVRPASRPTLAPGKPFLRFFISDTLRRKTLAALAKVEGASDPIEHRAVLSGIVVELTDAGHTYFFLRPLQLMKAGFLTEQSANLGMSGTLRVMGPVISNVIGRMSRTELLFVCRYIRELMA